MADHDASKEWTHAHSLRHGPQRLMQRRWRRAAEHALHHAHASTLLPSHAHTLPHPSSLAAAAAAVIRRAHRRHASSIGSIGAGTASFPVSYPRLLRRDSSEDPSYLAARGDEEHDDSGSSSADEALESDSEGEIDPVGREHALSAPPLPSLYSHQPTLPPPILPDAPSSQLPDGSPHAASAPPPGHSDELMHASQWPATAAAAASTPGAASVPQSSPLPPYAPYGPYAPFAPLPSHYHSHYPWDAAPHAHAHCAQCIALQSASYAAAPSPQSQLPHAATAASFSAFSSPAAPLDHPSYPPFYSPYQLQLLQGQATPQSIGDTLPPPSMLPTPAHTRQPSIQLGTAASESHPQAPPSAAHAASQASDATSSTAAAPLMPSSQPVPPASTASVPPARPALTSQPPPSPPVWTLPRPALVLLAILKETDGRDKLAKVVQYGARVLGIILRRLPALIWWTALLRRRNWSELLRAVRVILLEGRGCTVEDESAGAALAKAAAQSVGSPLSAVMEAGYIRSTSATLRVLRSNAWYTDVLDRVSLLSSTLSSGRRMIRTLKWSYTLPGWLKTLGEWKRQVQEGLEREVEKNLGLAEDDAQVQAAKEQEEEAKRKQQEQEKSRFRLPFRFEFSHPHPTHVWRRLPWLSSVELLDLTLALLTDMSDDLEWLSTQKLFPRGRGQQLGRVAMVLWFCTVVLDLVLTARIVRHYRYQARGLGAQIGIERRRYAEGVAALEDLARLREERAQRRLARDLKHQSMRKAKARHLRSETATVELDAIDATNDAASSSLVASAPDDSATVPSGLSPFLAATASHASTPASLPLSAPASSNSGSSSSNSSSETSSWSLLNGGDSGPSSGSSSSSSRRSSSGSNGGGSSEALPTHRVRSDSNLILSSSPDSSASPSVPPPPLPSPDSDSSPSSSSRPLLPLTPRRRAINAAILAHRRDSLELLSHSASSLASLPLPVHDVCERVLDHASHLSPGLPSPVPFESPLHSPPQPQQAADAEGKEEEEEEEAEDDEAREAEHLALCEAAHTSTVQSLHRLSDLSAQLAATRTSLFLQYLNFAKFSADLVCAFPTALNVHKEWEATVQTAGLASGILGLYKMAITIKPAS